MIGLGIREPDAVLSVRASTFVSYLIVMSLAALFGGSGISPSDTEVESITPY